MIPAPAIESHGLRKSYGRTEAARGIDLAVEQHRITGFPGRNGAAKARPSGCCSE